MSAEVILMNKNGIAIAADSAVTIGNKTKIYNTADKMFMLSKHAPVGILIYNNSSLMGIQIELIVKEYKEKLGENKFSTLLEYYDDFKKFCIEFTNEYSGEKLQIEMLNNQIFIQCSNIFTLLSDIIMQEVLKQNLKTDEELIEFSNSKLEEILKRKDCKIDPKVISDEYFKSIKDKLDIENIISINAQTHNIVLKDELKSKLIKTLTESIRNLSNWNKLNYSGIAITGYGEKEIFPSCIQMETLGILNNNLMITLKKEYKISHENDSSIIPLAQTDVMNEFFLGSNEEIEETYSKIFSQKINSEKDESKKVFLKELQKDMTDKRDEIIKMRYNSIYTSLSFLPREEMIYMAEGMINLTSFKRRLVLDNYSQTVGGPIDLAYISKGDGFIWIKRKQYFNKDLNYVFMENYFKKKGE